MFVIASNHAYFVFWILKANVDKKKVKINMISGLTMFLICKLCAKVKLAQIYDYTLYVGSSGLVILLPKKPSDYIKIILLKGVYFMFITVCVCICVHINK